MSTKINKISFLIHPGWFYEYATDEFLDPDKKVEAALIRPKAEALLRNYVEQAKVMGPDELLFVFTPSSVSRMERSVNRGHDLLLKALREIRKTLGRRAIVISDDNIEVLQDATELYKKAREIAKSRGFEFGKDVTSEAFGETLGACVDSGAEQFNTTEGLKKKTVVRTELTDAPSEIDGAFNLEGHKKKMERIVNRLEYR